MGTGLVSFLISLCLGYCVLGSSWILELGTCRSWWRVVCVWLETVVACKNALFNILDLLCYFSWNSLMMSMCVMARP